MANGISGSATWLSEVYLVNPSGSHAVAPLPVSCRWKVSNPLANTDAPRYFDSLDLILSVLPSSRCNEYSTIPDATNTTLESLVRRTWGALRNKTEVATKAILAPHEGYVARSDLLDLRMRNSEFVDAIISFPAWDEHLRPIGLPISGTLLSLLPLCAGVLVTKQSHLSYHETLDLVQADVEARLSFDWILPIKPASRRVAVVGGRPMADPKSGMYGSQGFFQAAQALGLSLIILDKPGHWIEGKQYAHLRDEFIAVDMSDLDEAPCRLVEAVRDKNIDGITTFTDEYVVATAKAAELLGLPSEPALAVEQTVRKDEMRKLVQENNVQVISLGSIDEVSDHLLSTLRYPMVVKPCRGRGSRGIKKVTDESSLRKALSLLEEDGWTEHGVLLETYVDGPEIDANFMLWNGEVLFLEVTDNFPCRADANSATLADNFAETVQISNTGLPQNEVDIIRSSLQRSLLKLGFRSGVFHVEARMQNSSMQYQDIPGTDMLELAPCTAAVPDGQPEVFLIEVNVRPPGTGGTWATLYTYGIDQGALHFLRAIDDQTRFEIFSEPFAFPASSPGGGGGAQYWNAQCMIPVHRENVRIPENFYERAFQLVPEVVPYVTRAEMYARPGTMVTLDSGIGFIGYLLLFSRESREHALRMYHRVAEACRKVLDSTGVYDSGYDS